MKKEVLNYLVMAAIILAVSLFFTSCGEEAPPSIAVKLDQQLRNEITVSEGSTVSVDISYSCDAGIKQIEILWNGKTLHPSYPKTVGFASVTTDMASFTLGPVWIETTKTESVVATYVTRITDIKDRVEEVTFSITVNSALEEEKAFSMVWSGKSVTDQERGIRCGVETGLFWVTSSTQGEKLVQITESDYKTITSSGLIRVVYDIVPDQNRRTFIDVPTESAFRPIYFVSKTENDEYYLIKWTALDIDFAKETATASFSSKK